MELLRRLYIRLGRIVYWLAWPVSWIYLRGSRRTRLLLLYQDEILVVGNWLGTGKYTLPGGGLHNNEDPKDGLVREVFEETGIILEKSAICSLGEEPIQIHGFRYSACYYYVPLPVKPAIRRQRFEIIDLQWVKRENINSKQHGPDVFRSLQLLDSIDPL